MWPAPIPSNILGYLEVVISKINILAQYISEAKLKKNKQFFEIHDAYDLSFMFRPVLFFNAFLQYSARLKKNFIK